MTKNKIIYLLLICIATSLYPSWADENAPPLASQTQPANSTNSTSNMGEPSPNATNTTQENSPTQVKSSPPTKSSLPKKVFSVAAALLVGTPVCIVRRTKYEEWYEVHGFVGDSDNKCKKILAAIVCFPYALICGTGEAPFDALANGLMYPAFSKDQLSQGKLIQNN
jgi:hypothetical protein